MSNICDSIAIIIIAILVLFSCFASGFSLKRYLLEKEVIKAGIAEYYLDNNFNKQFRFKKCE